MIDALNTSKNNLGPLEHDSDFEEDRSPMVKFRRTDTRPSVPTITALVLKDFPIRDNMDIDAYFKLKFEERFRLKVNHKDLEFVFQGLRPEYEWSTPREAKPRLIAE